MTTTQETLGQKQERFSIMLAQLLVFAYVKGYKVRMGETYRPKATAELYAKQGRGSKRSLHTLKLAADLNLFKDGKYIRTSKGHKELGEFWESLGGSWGGRFGDGNHYSIEHNGVK